MNRRTLLLVAALVVALSGTSAIFAYVSRLDSRATANERVVTVAVASGLVPAGTVGNDAIEADLLQLEEFPARHVPQGALTGLDTIRNEVAANDIQPGEVVVAQDFVSRQVAGSMEIPDDDVAITVKVTDFQRVADFVKPGLEVAVFHTYLVEYPKNPKEPFGETEEEDVTDLLLPRAKVLAIGPTAAKVVGGTPTDTEKPDQDEPAALVTLSVTIEDAAKVVHAQRVGEGYRDGALYLSLLTDRSNTDLKQPADDSTFLDGRRVSGRVGPSADDTTVPTKGA